MRQLFEQFVGAELQPQPIIVGATDDDDEN